MKDFNLEVDRGGARITDLSNGREIVLRAGLGLGTVGPSERQEGEPCLVELTFVVNSVSFPDGIEGSTRDRFGTHVTIGDGLRIRNELEGFDEDLGDYVDMDLVEVSTVSTYDRSHREMMPKYVSLRVRCLPKSFCTTTTKQERIAKGQ